VVILTRDEEANLPACLASLAGLTCRLYVVDSGSTDHTVAIAKTAGATVLTHPFEYYAAQRNWAQQHLPFTPEWVLHLDADERLTPELVTEIAALLQNPPQDIAGYMLRKRTVFMGRWIKHGGHYPSYHLRLFRHDLGRCEDRLYDQHFLVDGPVRALQHDYIDVVSTDLNTWLLRHVRWAGLEAAELSAQTSTEDRVRPAFWGNPIAHRRWLRTDVYNRSPRYLRAFLYWFYRYILRLGFLDGKEGFVFHFLQALWFRLLVDIRLEEIERSRAHPVSSTPTMGTRA
jgi:glycosyltransferase involved in cell wall biosynthesis